MELSEDYLVNIENLRNLRLENRKRFHQASFKMAHLLEEIKGDPYAKEVPIIYYEDLDNLEKGIWYDIEGNIFFKVEEGNDDSKILEFSCIYKPGAKEGLKKVDTEHTLHIHEGRIIDLYSNKVHIKGSEFTYLAYEPHEFASDINSRYTVFLHNPKNKDLLK